MTLLGLLFNRSQYFWIPGLAFSVSLGVFNAWITQVDTMFDHTVGVGQVCQYIQTW